VHKATSSKTRLAHRARVVPTKINRGSSKIIKPVIRPATTDRTIPSLTVRDLPVAGLSVVTPETTLRVLPLEVSVSPLEVTVPVLGGPTVTAPGVPPSIELPPVTLPPTDSPRLIPPANHQAVAEPAALRAAPLDGVSPELGRETRRTPRGIVATSLTVLAAHTLSTLSVPALALTSIGPPVVATFDELGKQVSTMGIPTSVGPTATALVLAAALGAAATGTAGSGSAGSSGLAVSPAALALPALRGSSRLGGRLRVSAFRRPRLPGFSPD
jgi:hypothetical protein